MDESAQVAEAQRARFLATRYPKLFGLRIVPWGVVLGLVPLVTGSLVTGSAWWIVLGTFLASIPAAGLLTWLGGRYYRRRFGRVRAQAPSGLQLLGWLGAFGGLAVLYWLLRQVAGAGTVGEAGLVYAAVLAFTAWRMGPFAWHRLAVAGLLALAGVLPMGTVTDSGAHPLRMATPYPLMILGASLVVIGLVDHWLLARAFRRDGQPR